MSISFEGVIYLLVMGVVLTAAVTRQINLLMILYGVMAGPLLLSWRLVRKAVKDLEIARHLPPTVFAGRPFSIELELTNKKRRGGSFAVWIRDELQRRSAGSEKPIATDLYFPYVPAGESRKSSYQGILNIRGVYDFQPVKLSSRFPLGLLRTMIRVDKPQRLVVLPSIGKLSPVWHRLLATDGDAPNGRQRSQGSADGDFYGLREWRAGDSRGRIHWRTSARRQSLTVRQFERRRQSELVLIVDLWEPKNPNAEDRHRVEEVIRFAATVLHELCREPSRKLRLEIVGKTPRTLQATSTQQALHEGLKLLAAAEPTREDRLPKILIGVTEQGDRGAGVVIAATRRNDLMDHERFALLGKQTETQASLNKITSVSPVEPRWRELFDPGAP
ncbi:MAG: DUF58 domain-containing protein [Planctomycetia bacterium]|nr:DUF58 domain-containing protein [Planctomycetia bacterium]